MLPAKEAGGVKWYAITPKKYRQTRERRKDSTPKTLERKVEKVL